MILFVQHVVSLLVYNVAGYSVAEKCCDVFDTDYL